MGYSEDFQKLNEEEKLKAFQLLAKQNLQLKADNEGTKKINENLQTSVARISAQLEIMKNTSESPEVIQEKAKISNDFRLNGIYVRPMHGAELSIYLAQEKQNLASLPLNTMIDLIDSLQAHYNLFNELSHKIASAKTILDVRASRFKNNQLKAEDAKKENELKSPQMVIREKKEKKILSKFEKMKLLLMKSGRSEESVLKQLADMNIKEELKNG